MNRFFAFVPLLVLPLPTRAQAGNPLRELLLRDTTAAVRQVMRDPAGHRVQVLYTQIRRDGQGRATFKSYALRLKPAEYFYPASTVKLPAAALALEKLREQYGSLVMRSRGMPLINRETPLRIDSVFAGQTKVRIDSTAPGYQPTIGNYIRKVLLVSDNDAFNRLYEYVGQASLASLKTHGLAHTRIIHRLSVGDKEPGSRHTNPFVFMPSMGGAVGEVHQAADYNEQPLPRLQAKSYRIGKAYLAGDKRVDESMDFSTKNFFPLDEQQQVLRALLFPEFVPARQRFGLAADDYTFLRKYLCLPPRLSQYPRYDAEHYPDNYAKFLLVGGPPAPLPEGVRIYNKIGQAYGFLIDNACIVDSLRGVEFMLSAVVYCNADEVLNDDHYDYDTVGFPFLRRLGELVYQYELGRTDDRRRAQVRAYWADSLQQATP